MKVVNGIRRLLGFNVAPMWEKAALPISLLALLLAMGPFIGYWTDCSFAFAGIILAIFGVGGSYVAVRINGMDIPLATLHMTVGLLLVPLTLDQFEQASPICHFPPWAGPALADNLAVLSR